MRENARCSFFVLFFRGVHLWCRSVLALNCAIISDVIHSFDWKAIEQDGGV